MDRVLLNRITSIDWIYSRFVRICRIGLTLGERIEEIRINFTTRAGCVCVCYTFVMLIFVIIRTQCVQGARLETRIFNSQISYDQKSTYDPMKIFDIVKLSRSNIYQLGSRYLYFIENYVTTSCRVLVNTG